MKTSNILVLTASLIIVFAMFGYDFFLKKEYDSGDYKIPFKGFGQLNFRDFDIIDLHSSTAANAKIIQGPFSILVDKNAGYIKVKQHGNRLEIDAVFPGNYSYNPNQYVLLISCPHLKEVNANATYISNDREVTDVFVRDDWFMRQVLIDGFQQDSIHVSQDYGSTVVLAGNTIRSLSAEIGNHPQAGSKLIIESSNHFKNTFLDIRNKSSLFLENASIENLNFHIADSAKIEVSGDAEHLLNHSNK